MKKQNTQQRLFEIMSRLDKTFKPKLNEIRNFNHYGTNTVEKEYEYPDGEPYPEFTIEATIEIDEPEPSVGYHGSITADPKLKAGSYDPQYEQIIQQWISSNMNEIEKDMIKVFNKQIKDSEDDYWDSVASSREDDRNAQYDDLYETDEGDDDENFPISTPVGSEDDKLFIDIVNQGIDSNLEGFTKSNFEVKPGSLGNRRIFNFHKSEMPILLRRLGEVGTEEAQQWIEDIQNQESNVNELDEMARTSNNINPKYTHFAALKDSNKILNGWEYAGYEPDELKMGKKEYFFNDIIDMDIDPKIVGIYTRKKLEKMGINPFDTNNWYKFDSSNNDPEQYTNDVNEIFGFSQKEKDTKSFTEKIEKAKQEILKYPPSHIFGQPGSNDTPQDNINLMKTRLNMMKQNCPTLAELIPELFDPNQGNANAIYPSNDGGYRGFVPRIWYRYVVDNNYVDNDKAVEKISVKLDEILAHQQYAR